MNFKVPPRIVVTGAESTGKSTFARELAAYLGTLWSPEMARYYLDAKQELDGDDVLPIAYGQRGLELWLEPQARDVLICDTDTLSTIIYARELYGFTSDELEALLQKRPAILYLLLDTDVEWQSDPTPGQRGGSEARAHFQSVFRAELEARRLPHQLISAQGDYSKRLDLGRAAVDEIIARKQIR